jgi:hypothetical protein
MKVRLQLKSTLVDRIIRDLGLIPPDHDVIKESQTLGRKLTSKLGLRKILRGERECQ